MQRKKVETEGLVRLLLSGLLLKVKQRVSFSNTQPLHDNRLVNEFEKSRNREPVCVKNYTHLMIQLLVDPPITAMT